MKICMMVILMLGFFLAAFSQSDSLAQTEASSIFARLDSAGRNYQLDTSDAPEDRLTKEIRKLRGLKEVFTITDFLEFEAVNGKSMTTANTSQSLQVQKCKEVGVCNNFDSAGNLINSGPFK